jgi:probable HAF family extracellular repeat protein
VKSKLCVCIATLAILASLGTSQLSAQHRYKLIDMGTLGGPQSYLNDGNGGNNAVGVLTNRGTVAGWADTLTPDPFPAFCFDDDCYVSHAFQWRNGTRIDLGALAEGLSSQANWISANGLTVGGAENGEIDPLIANLPETRAVLWRNRHIIDLGTLPEGGYESWATSVNTRGQVTGWGTNLIPDDNSMAAPGFLPTQTRAFLWQKGAMLDLGTLGTGTDAMAQFINEAGQIVGWSYTGESQPTTCIVPLPTHSFIWDEEKGMRDLGTLGGNCVIATGINNHGVVIGDNVNDLPIQRAFFWKNGSIQDLGGTIGGTQAGAEAINDSGEVAGFATLAGEVFYHATLWRRAGEITDLGVLKGDLCSFASSINSHSQIVGASQAGTPDNGCFSFDTSPPRAFLWDNGSIVDLNSLIPSGASLDLYWAIGINDKGEIAGLGAGANGDTHAFLLVPCDDDRAPECRETVTDRPSTLPSTALRQPISNHNSMQRLLHHRIGLPVPPLGR